MESNKNSLVKTPDLRWPDAKSGIQVGAGILLIISILMLLLMAYKGGTSNPWLVITPKDGELLSPEYITSVFTAPFFHSDWKHLWVDLLGLWVCGLVAFAVAGYQRALVAIAWGIVLAGLALVITGGNGDEEIRYFGATPIIFAFAGIIVQAATRRGVIFILAIIIAISFVDKMLLRNLQEWMGTAEIDNLWLANFFGFVGGLMADLKNPTEAVRILYKRSLISDAQAERLLRKCEPELYDGTNQPGAKKTQPPAVTTATQERPEETEAKPAATTDSDASQSQP